MAWRGQQGELVEEMRQAMANGHPANLTPHWATGSVRSHRTWHGDVTNTATDRDSSGGEAEELSLQHCYPQHPHIFLTSESTQILATGQQVCLHEYQEAQHWTNPSWYLKATDSSPSCLMTVTPGGTLLTSPWAVINIHSQPSLLHAYSSRILKFPEKHFRSAFMKLSKRGRALLLDTCLTTKHKKLSRPLIRNTKPQHQPRTPSIWKQSLAPRWSLQLAWNVPTQVRTS